MLIFYERLTEQKVHEDFDQASEIVKNLINIDSQIALTKRLEEGREVSR